MFSTHLQPKTVITAVISLNFLLFAGLSPAQAVPHRSATVQQLVLDDLSFSFVPPEDSGQPRTNRAGGRRDQLCNHSTPLPSLTLLIPPTNQGLTTAQHPTFLIYIPQTSAQNVFLKLEDEHDNYLYHTTIPLPEGSGIVSFTIPNTAPALELEKYYKISLAIMCNTALDPNDPIVEGWIKRVESDTSFSSQEEQKTALELSAAYASNGIWFDALTILANLHQSQPDNPDVTLAWEEFLQSVDLDSIQDAMILNPLY
ncbi:MAG: DUF928 domain-containing protein [Cyanobacteria bacterium P01_H01_bin.105]